MRIVLFDEDVFKWTWLVLWINNFINLDSLSLVISQPVTILDGLNYLFTHLQLKITNVKMLLIKLVVQNLVLLSRKYEVRKTLVNVETHRNNPLWLFLWTPWSNERWPFVDKSSRNKTIGAFEETENSTLPYLAENP